MNYSFPLSRRAMLQSACATFAISSAGLGTAHSKPSGEIALASDETFWKEIAALYDKPAAITNLEAGYWGVMSAPVRKAFRANMDRLNRESSIYIRGGYNQDIGKVYTRLADFLGVSADELLLVRSASEALQILLGGYNKLKPGDHVLYADLDYNSFKPVMGWLKERRGAQAIMVNLPEPATTQAIIDAYRQALDNDPKIKMMLLTHLNNITGLIHPVKEITAIAKERGVDVILDSAHAIGQIAYDFTATGADFVGLNLHKWIGAPLGSGLIYIRKNRIADIDPFMGEPGDADDIRIRAHTGARNFATHLTIPAALDFHERIGITAKEARLRHLRNLWVDAVRSINNLQILTPDDPDMVAGMTAFRFAGRTSTAENNAIVSQLANEHDVFTVRRSGAHMGDCVRVTPALYNSADDVLALAKALKAIA